MKKTKSRFNLKNKNALITGGGGLLGSEHAIALAKWGCNIILIDIDEVGLENARKRIIDEIPEALVKTAVIDITLEKV